MQVKQSNGCAKARNSPDLLRFAYRPERRKGASRPPHRLRGKTSANAEAEAMDDKISLIPHSVKKESPERPEPLTLMVLIKSSFAREMFRLL